MCRAVWTVSAAWRLRAGRYFNLSWRSCSARYGDLSNLSGKTRRTRVRGVRLRLIWVGALVPVLAGCGSSSSSFAITCTVHRLGPRVLQARATVTNGTSHTTNVIIYGPALLSLHHFAPVTLRPTQVMVRTGHGKTSYFGLVVPNVSPDHPAHLRLQFAPPPHAESIWADDKRTIDTAGTGPSSTCLIRHRG